MSNMLEATFTFRNMDSTEALRDHTVDKLSKLDKYLIKPATAHVIFNMDGSRHVAEITVNTMGVRYIGIDTTNDMYMSVDGAVEKLKKQISKTKERTKNHKG